MAAKSNDYFPSLDGLRAISITLVYLSHLLVASKIYTTSPIPGGLGVTIFFFISGFLITNLLLAEFKKDHKINLKLFYIRRVLRLYPPMLLMMICITAFLWFTQRTFLYKELMAALFYYENYFLAYHMNYADKYGILWSLAIEEHFYILFPFILLMLLKKPRFLFGGTIILTMIPLILRLQIANHYNANDISDYHTYLLTHYRFDSILYGCLTAMIINSKYAYKFLNLISAKPIYMAALIVFCYTMLYRNEFFRQTIRYSMQGLSFMCLIPLVIYNRKFTLFKNVLSSKAMVFIGKLSYSIYLFHFVVIKLLEYFLIPNTVIYIIVNIILSVAFSLISYFYLEVPIMKLRKRFGSTVKATVTKVESAEKLLA
jgi:peptidoglycan/LPS O-acetylase OafA/YrhL